MSRTQTPLYSRILLAVVRPFPNFDFGFIQPVRAKAVDVLRLTPGARVVDAGCGSGGSFSHLVRAVGKTGEVVGIEISPGAVEHARRRVEKNKWSNVSVELAPAQSVALSVRFEGLLMFAAPDVFASPEALRNLIPALQDGARVVFFGAKRSTRPLGWLLNRTIHFALTRFSLPTTPGLELEPWHCAAFHLRDLEVQEYFYGWMFLAAGTLKRR
jgi:SAM-dependent methyltransferase